MIGPRTLPRLAAVIQDDPDDTARAGALAVLEGMQDRRALDLALRALAAVQAEVAAAAARVLRGWVTHETGTRVLDALTTVALDQSRPQAVREAAVDALSELPGDLVKPILERGQFQSSAAADDADAVRDWLGTSGQDAPLSALHDAIVHARDREQREASPAARQEWHALRGAAHAALARRGSRVALYDLRETFAGATAPLTLDYLNAIAALGDASCLEPMAHAWAAAPADAWWRERLSAAAEAIVHRTRLSARSAVLKRVRAKWDGFV